MFVVFFDHVQSRKLLSMNEIHNCVKTVLQKVWLQDCLGGGKGHQGFLDLGA